MTPSARQRNSGSSQSTFRAASRVKAAIGLDADTRTLSAPSTYNGSSLGFKALASISPHRNVLPFPRPTDKAASSTGLSRRVTAAKKVALIGQQKPARVPLYGLTRARYARRYAARLALAGFTSTVMVSPHPPSMWSLLDPRCPMSRRKATPGRGPRTLVAR